MPTLSLAMIVKDEARTLKRVLDAAAQFCDEMVVVDTGSADETVRIAHACGAKVEHFPWCDDFAAARNYSFAACTSDWILWLDADDVLTPETIEIGKRIKNETLGTLEHNAVFAPYRYVYDEQGRCVLTHSRERFLRRSCGFQWDGKVHEAILRAGESFVVCPEFIVEHRPVDEQVRRKTGRNLRIMQQDIDVQTCSLRDLHLYSGELLANDKFEESLAVMATYLARPDAGAPNDLHDEAYTVHVVRTETYRRLKKAKESLASAAAAIAHNGARAEGYGLLGLTHFETGNYHAAFPAFLAAAACKRPEHGGIVYDAFYSAAIHDMIKESKRLIEASK